MKPNFVSLFHLIALVMPAQAGTYYWDLNQTADNVAAAVTGAWNGTNLFWNTDSTGGTGGAVSATPGNADDLVFSSGSLYTTGTVTASNSRAASSVTFEDNIAVTLAGPLTIGGTGLKNGIFVSSGANANNIVSGALSLNGANTIQKAGTGTLTLGSSISGNGNLVFNNNNSGAISLSSTTAGAFNFTGSITNSGTGTGGVNIGGSSTANALIGSNVTSITQNSATSALTVFGGNTFTGGVKILAGTANLVNSNASAGASGSITLGAISGSADASVYIGSGAGNATPITVQAGSSGVKTIGGVYTGVGGTTMTYSGNLTLNDSVTVYQNSSGATVGLVLSGSTISIANGKTMTLKNIVATTSQLTVSGKLTGAGGVTLSQGGATISNAANDYTGGTLITGGNLVFSALGAIPATGSITINNGGALNASGAYTTVAGWLGSGKIATGSNGTIAITAANSETLDFSSGGYNSLALGSAGTFTYSGAITPGSNGYNFGGGGGTLTVSTALTSASSALNAGTGTVVLSGAVANTYSGLTTVNSGTLGLNKTAGISAVGGNVSILGGSLRNDADEQISDSATVTLNGSTAAWATSGKKETLANLNVQSTAASGLTTGSAPGSGFNVTVTDTLGHSGGNITLNSGGTSISAGSLVNTGGTWTFGVTSGTQSVQVGAGGLTIGGGSVIAIATAATATSNNISLLGNVISQANATTNTISTSGTNTGELRLNATRTIDVANGAAASDLTISALITNGAATSGIVKTGAGVLTLSGNNGYTGTTTVNDGTLVIDGNISTSITSVNDGGTLSGTGTVAALNINDGGTLAIGSSPGTLNIAGDLTLAPGSTSDFEINAFTSGNFDLALAALAGSQTVNFNGGTLNLLFQPGFNTEGTVKIFDFDVYAGTGFTTILSSGLASGFTASFDATSGIVTVVPEPNSAALIASFGLLALLRRHRN